MVKIRLGASVIETNEKGELEMGQGKAIDDLKVSAKEMDERILGARNFEEAYEMLRDTGAFMMPSVGEVMVVSRDNGTIIFMGNEKIAVDKDVPASVVEEIMSLDTRDGKDAVEKVLMENNLIENKENEVEKTVSDRDGVSLEINEADNVHGIAENGTIAEVRAERDQTEDPNRGVYNEEDTRKMYEERKKLREQDKEQLDR